MDTAIDSVFQGLLALAEQGVAVRIAVHVDGAVITGTLATPAAYRAEVAQRIGQEPGRADSTDGNFLHLVRANVSGANTSETYCCSINAVRGYSVIKLDTFKPKP
jgi:hypothetical protein